jgi:hypothetical protein
MPKKLGRSLLDIRRTSEIEKDVVGWGVHIIEGPNRARITLLTVVVVGVSLIVPLIYTVMTKDISGGYAIGAWIVAAWTAILTALFYQWMEE